MKNHIRQKANKGSSSETISNGVLKSPKTLFNQNGVLSKDENTPNVLPNSKGFIYFQRTRPLKPGKLMEEYEDG